MNEGKWRKMADDSPDAADHMPTYGQYAAGRVVTEFGVRWGHSTLGFMLGGPRRLTSYDINSEKIIPVDMLTEAAHDLNVDWRFVCGNTLEITIEPCDVLLIDTVHTGAQVAAELARHADNVRRFILLHDTAMMFRTDDCNSTDIWDAIIAFVNHGYWRIAKHYANNNGLTVLERVP
jgi:hypothetical protein